MRICQHGKGVVTWGRHCSCVLQRFDYHAIFEEPGMLEIVKLSAFQTDFDITTLIPLSENDSIF